jgi:PAS domain S-box-containing protein
MKSILYVDDDLQLLDIGKRLLERSGDLAVYTTCSGRQAIELIEHGSFDAIISDYDMPEMNGIDLLKLIRLQHHKLPFVLFTGKEREEVVIRALNHGADFYLQKGGDINVIFLELENIIKRLVDQWYLKIALEQSEQRYRLLVDNAQEGIYIIQNERIVSSNFKFLHLIHSLGFSSDDIETTPSIFDFIHPEDKKELRERYYLRISHSINDNISRFRAIDKNGLIHYFQVHAVNTEWNEKPATLNFLQDITYQQSLNSIHHNYENHFRELVDNLPKTVIELDLNFFLIYINKVGIKKLGYNLENLIGNTHITDLFIQSDQEKFIHHVSMM